MDTVGKSEITKDEMIIELVNLLKQNNMSVDANETFELCTYIDGLEKKLDAITEELINVKTQIRDMQEDTVLNNLKFHIQASTEKLQATCTNMKDQLLVVKENIHTKAVDIINDVKRRGKVALNRVSEFIGIKNKLVNIRENVKKSQQEVSRTILKIEEFGAGIREANQKVANTFRTFADKEIVDYSKTERKYSKTELIKKPFLANKTILIGMELRLDAAIKKVDNLSRDVEINQMMKQYDSSMRQPHENLANTTALVAEPDQMYGADVFETRIQSSDSKNISSDPIVQQVERSKGR